MRILKIHGSQGHSTLYLGGSLLSLSNYVSLDNTVILADVNVKKFYGSQLPPCKIIEIGEGEKIKTLDTVREIYRRLTVMEVDRSSFLVGIGGGVVCDMAGFVGSTFLRGLRFGFVPSTLLSQVDASVGGKNGLNLDGYKNIIGTFNQPKFVICDPDLLYTLPEREISNGLAEVLKHALLGSASLFAFLERNAEDILRSDRTSLEKIIFESIEIKAGIVNRDERERGLRRKLNLGHTLGHALEKVKGISHGEAVSLGIRFAARFSREKGYLTAGEFKRIENLITRLCLPALTETYDPGEIIEAIQRDKKRERGKIHFVFLKGVGDAAVEEVGLQEIGAALGRCAPPESM